jgi:hypothetical protein
MSLAWLHAALVWGLALGAQPSVSIEVDVLGASDQTVQVPAPARSPKVSVHLERDLRTTLKFKHYRELGKNELNVAIGETGETTLPNGGQLRLTPISFDATSGMIELRVQNQKEHYELDTQYSIKNGGTLFVTAGQHEQEVLVVAITPKAQ